ncbi:MAG: hypothetical protein IOMNBAOH_01935 [Rhodocyclaceae bacterium]|nr:hypothetical protein [Rhodocyclaceae bacterium]
MPKGKTVSTLAAIERIDQDIAPLDRRAALRRALLASTLGHALLLTGLPLTASIPVMTHLPPLWVSILPPAEVREATALPKAIPLREPNQAGKLARQYEPDPRAHPSARAPVASTTPPATALPTDSQPSGTDKATTMTREEPMGPGSWSGSPTLAPSSPSASKGASEEPDTAQALAYLSNPKPDYPWSLRRRGIEGTVRLRVNVAADGLPTDVMVVSSSGFDEMDRAALEAVKSWRFQPARRSGQAVAALAEVPIVFRLSRH